MTVQVEKMAPPKPARTSRRKVWIWAGAACGCVLVGLIVGLTLLARHAEPFMRQRIVAALQDHFHARVELDSFQMASGNSLHGEWGIWAVGRGLRIWPPEQMHTAAPPVTGNPASAKPPAGVSHRSTRKSAAPHSIATAPPAPVASTGPLIQLGEFRFHVPLRFQPGKPLHIALVQLTGLKIDVPPRSHTPKPAAEVATKEKGVERRAIIEVERIECTRVQLTVETDKPGKVAQVYDISRASFTGVSATQPTHFEADLTIPRPQGAVHSSGNFGPWTVSDPGESPIAGDYRLSHADLGVFKGIGGNLDSTGHYEGTLRDMNVNGQTSSPDFRLKHFGNTLPLKTTFRARVDGTNGDTRLDSVDATLGRSHFTTQGAILRIAPNATNVGGHLISLAVQVDHTPIEDLLRLASHSANPILSGSVVAKAELHIPPGPAPVHERINIAGHFSLDSARFSSPGIQSKIEQLSLRSQGHPDAAKNSPPVAISSQMQGDFHLEGGILSLSTLDYSVPGTTIELQGKYGIEGGTLDFRGRAKMDATVSQMVGGWKGLLLKPTDRFFRKDGAGTSVPIHITGTRDQPVFGVEVAGKELNFSRRGRAKD